MPPVCVSICHADPIVHAGLTALLAPCPQLRLASGEADLEQAPRVVLTDYDDALARRARAMTLGERVLIVSHREREWDVRTALQAGVHGYLAQRCDVVELTEALTALGQGQRYFSRELLAPVMRNLNGSSLTQRESEVLALLATGVSNKRIALTLDISVGTVKTHVKSLFIKLGATARTHAVVLAGQRGLVSN